MNLNTQNMQKNLKYEGLRAATIGTTSFFFGLVSLFSVFLLSSKPFHFNDGCIDFVLFLAGFPKTQKMQDQYQTSFVALNHQSD